MHVAAPARPRNSARGGGRHMQHMPSASAALPLGDVGVLVVGNVVANELESFPHLIAALNRVSTRVDVHLCVGNSTRLPTRGVVLYATSVLRFHDYTVDQFQRAHACWRQLKSDSNSIRYDWFVRTRPDIAFVPGGSIGPMDVTCIHSKLREVKNLANVTQHTMSSGMCLKSCLGVDVDGPADRACMDVDDEFTMVPSALAPAFFSFGSYDFAHSRYSSLGECRGLDGPENRLTQWLVHKKVDVCPIGHAASGFNVRYYLHKAGNYLLPNFGRHQMTISKGKLVSTPPEPCFAKPKACGIAPLSHAQWREKIRSYPVKVCPHPKPMRFGQMGWQPAKVCAEAAPVFPELPAFNASVDAWKQVELMLAARQGRITHIARGSTLG